MDGAVLAVLHLFDAVGAPQGVLQSFLQAAVADEIVHLVALVLQLLAGFRVGPVLGVDGTHRAHDMGQDGAVGIHPGTGLHDLGPGEGQTALLDDGHRLHAHIVGQGKVVALAEAFQLHLVPDAGQNALPLGGVVLQVILLGHAFQQLIGGGVGLLAEPLLQGLQPPLLPGQSGVVGGIGGLVHSIGKGLGGGERQSVVPALAVALQNLHQLLEGLVEVAGHHALAQLHLVAGAVGGDAAAVAVDDVAPGGADLKVVDLGVLRLLEVIFAVDQLKIDQLQHKYGHYHHRTGDHDPDAPGQAFHLVFLLHGTILFWGKINPRG